MQQNFIRKMMGTHFISSLAAVLVTFLTRMERACISTFTGGEALSSPGSGYPFSLRINGSSVWLTWATPKYVAFSHSSDEDPFVRDLRCSQLAGNSRTATGSPRARPYEEGPAHRTAPSGPVPPRHRRLMLLTLSARPAARHAVPGGVPPAPRSRRRPPGPGPALLSDNFAHRTSVRHALANDKDWQEKFLSKALPLIEVQHNEVAYLVPWCQLGKPPKEGGVYEWVTFQMKPGGPALWGEAFQAAINAHINTGYTRLIGVFHTEYGLLNTVHVIWWNESPDHRAAGRHSAHEDARVVAAVRDSVRFLESQQNMLLIPLQCSPLK